MEEIFVFIFWVVGMRLVLSSPPSGLLSSARWIEKIADHNEAVSRELVPLIRNVSGTTENLVAPLLLSSLFLGKLRGIDLLAIATRMRKTHLKLEQKRGLEVTHLVRLTGVLFFLLLGRLGWRLHHGIFFDTGWVSGVAVLGCVFCFLGCSFVFGKMSTSWFFTNGVTDHGLKWMKHVLLSDRENRRIQDFEVAYLDQKEKVKDIKMEGWLPMMELGAFAVLFSSVLGPGVWHLLFET